MEAVQRTLATEVKALVVKKNPTNPPTLQKVKREMESTNAYTDIFPEIFKLMNIVVITSSRNCNS